MRRAITIVWEDDPEFDNADHYKFIGEFHRLATLMAVKFLKQEEEATGYRTKMKITQD